MFSLSQTSGYAILALGFLHECGDRLVLAKDITLSTRIPLPYLSKILNALTRTGLIVGKRGYQGGFALSRTADEISLYDVAEAVEGPNWLPTCPLGIVGCSKHPLCPIHDFWTVQRAKIMKELRQLTLTDISAYVKEKFLTDVDGYSEPDLSNLQPSKKVTISATDRPSKKVSSSATGRRSPQKSQRKSSKKTRS
jgi:Rrf2 family transcriptional regulator, iron-sulfur cluster assembly transcription factor